MQMHLIGPCLDLVYVNRTQRLSQIDNEMTTYTVGAVVVKDIKRKLLKENIKRNYFSQSACCVDETFST